METSHISSLEQIRASKAAKLLKEHIAALPDEIEAFLACYLSTNVFGIRNEQVAQKIVLHLCRFQQFIEEVCDPQGHISLVTKAEIQRWQSYLDEDVGFARATTNSHLASLSGFYTWVYAQRPDLFAMGNPCAGIGELPLPDLEPQALNPDQVKRLKDVCNHLPSFHEHKGKRYQKQRKAGKVSEMCLHAHARPYRDRAIVYVLLSTGLRREELVLVNLEQVEPHEPEALREAERARITRVRGKRKSLRTLWLSKDARAALSDYLQGERATDAAAFAAMGEDSAALFLRASNVAQSKPPKDAERGGRLALRAVNYLVEHIGALYNAELDEGEKLRINGKLHPHTLRHTFAYLLSEETGADAYELQRRLGHRSERYIQLYTSPPAEIAAGYVEKF